MDLPKQFQNVTNHFGFVNKLLFSITGIHCLLSYISNSKIFIDFTSYFTHNQIIFIKLNKKIA